MWSEMRTLRTVYTRCEAVGMRFFASVIFILSDSVARVTTSNFCRICIIIAVKFYTRTSCSCTKSQSVCSKLVYVHDLISLTRMPHRFRFMLSCEAKRTKWKSTAKQIVAPAHWHPRPAPAEKRSYSKYLHIVSTVNVFLSHHRHFKSTPP